MKTQKIKIIILLLAATFVLSNCSSVNKKYLDQVHFQFDNETGTAQINGKTSFKIEQTGCGLFDVECSSDIYDKDGKKVLLVVLDNYKSPMEVRRSNPEGKVPFYKFVFLDSQEKAEVKYLGTKAEKIAKFIASNKLFKDGKLDKQKAKEFVLRYGQSFSKKIKF